MQQNRTENKVGSTYDLISSMEKGLAIAKTKLATHASAQILQARCAPMLDVFQEHINSIRVAAPNVEQLKGLTSGLKMASPVVLQFADVLRAELPDIKDEDKLKFGMALVNRIAKATAESHVKQREEMLKSLGKLEGMVNTAMGLLKKVEGYITHHEAKLQQEAEAQAEDANDQDANLVGGVKPPAPPKVPTSTTKKTKASTTKRSKKASPKNAK